MISNFRRTLEEPLRSILWEQLERIGKEFTEEEYPEPETTITTSSGEGVEAYPVYLSNPVCPCCGAKLVIMDDSKEEENTLLDLSPESGDLDKSSETGFNGILESLTDLSYISKIKSIYNTYVSDLLYELIDYYYNLGYNQEEIINRLTKRPNRTLSYRINLKALELKSELEYKFDLDLGVKELELDLENSLRKRIDCMRSA